MPPVDSTKNSILSTKKKAGKRKKDDQESEVRLSLETAYADPKPISMS
jgi:hypothetical protein